MYSITYRTKRGGSGVMTTNDLGEMLKRVHWLFKQRLSATVYFEGEVIGRVYEDDSQRYGWNWFVDTRNGND